MYDYIAGNLTYKNYSNKGAFATVETGGIGYSCEIMERDYGILPEISFGVKFYTVLVHREDKMSLCGFLRREDRDLFNVLTSVSGVGVKMALVLLNSFEVSDLAGFVLDGDYKQLTRAKGVGPKLAQKIILELKDKLTSYEGSIPISTKHVTGLNSQNAQDAKLVLLSLGYNNDEAEGAMENVLSRISKDSSAEEILKESLRLLSLG